MWIYTCMFVATALAVWTDAQDCSMNVCNARGITRTCYDRIDPPLNELSYVCECLEDIDSHYMGPECNVIGDHQNLYSCYGIDCATGSFQSINWPDTYPPRHSAGYVCYIPGAKSITLIFDPLFHVEEPKDELYIGPGVEYSVANFRGVSQPGVIWFYDGQAVPESLTIKTDSFWMYFGTDKNLEYSGWKVTWSAG
ncbi:fibropellin-3-like [Saccoglossus kowalevskii]